MFNAFTPNIHRWQRCPSITQLRHTDIQATVLHLFPVFQVHGPHVAIEQARRVRDGVLSRTESDENTVRTSTKEKDDKLPTVRVKSFICSPSSSLALLVGY